MHTSAPDWCEPCILSLAPEKSHGTTGVDDDFIARMIAVDRGTDMAVSFVADTKECDAYVVQNLTNPVDQLHQSGRVDFGRALNQHRLL